MMIESSAISEAVAREVEDTGGVYIVPRLYRAGSALLGFPCQGNGCGYDHGAPDAGILSGRLWNPLPIRLTMSLKLWKKIQEAVLNL